jgi:anaerobic selenocysteine-containing dehydrogenase
MRRGPDASSMEACGKDSAKTYCPYCGVGCGLVLDFEGGRPTKVRGDVQHPANFGEICAKAAHLLPTISPPGRALYPQIRRHRGESLKRTTWGDSLGYIAGRFNEIIDRHGPDAIAFYGSGQLLTEDYYVFNKLAKGFLGTNNFDTNSRLCMASTVAAYSAALGADGPPGCYADIELADLFLLVGTNTAWCHPIVFRRIEKRKQQDPANVKVIVVDPRRTRTAELADLHLPIKPGTDLILLNAILAHLIRIEAIDGEFIRQHTHGWDALRENVTATPLERSAAQCGIAPDQIIETATLFGRAQRPLSMWSMGANQSSSGTKKNLGIINLHLATGKIGRPGCGPFSLTGQPNAMGGRETGGLAHLLPGYRRIANASDRVEVARLWGLGPSSIASSPGLSALEIFDGLLDGRVKAVWIICTNPAVSMPDLNHATRALAAAELVVVQDSFHPTDTTMHADVILPAAHWPEKEGVMTNSERRITYLPKLLDPPGEAMPDWAIGTMFAQTMGYAQHFDYLGAEAIFNEYRTLTTGTLLDISGVTYQRLREGPIQWPCPSLGHAGTARLYSDYTFATPDGCAHFVLTDYHNPAEAPDADYPLILTTGRVRNQWHTMTRTGTAPALLKDAPAPYLEVNPADAASAGLGDRDWAEARSRRGIFIAQVRVTEAVPVGTCFAPFHWGRQAGKDRAANNLTNRAIDPLSKQPELKFAAICLRRLPQAATDTSHSEDAALTSQTPNAQP